jgi:hypothetical protein
LGQEASAPVLTLQDHVSGAVLAVAVQGNYAYLGFSYELVVLDIADRGYPQWVAALPVSANAIALADPYAYAVGRTGFTIIDITDPTRPQLRSVLPTVETAADVVITADAGYFIAGRQLHQVDLIDPSRPQIKQTITLPSRTLHLTAAAGDLYVSTFAGVYRFDLAATPLTATCLMPTATEPSAVVVMAHYLLFGSSSTLHIVDLTSPTPCQPRTLITVAGWISDLAVVDTTLFMTTVSTGLRIWDMTDPQAPVAMETYPTGGLALRLTTQDGYLYLVDCNDGLQIFTIDDPQHLTLVSRMTPLGMTGHLAVVGDDAYLTAGVPLQLHRVDLHTPTRLHPVLDYGATAVIYDLAQVDAHLFLLTAQDLQIIDVATPARPHTVATYPIADPTRQNLWYAVATHTHAYLGDTAGNVWLVDLAASGQPITDPRYLGLGHVGAMVLADGYAYLPAPGGGLRILAVAANGELTACGVYPTAEQINRITVADGYAYLGGAQGLSVLDVRGPCAPTLVRHCATPQAVVDIALVDHYALLAAGQAGLLVLDITNPAQPVAVAAFATPSCAYRVISAHDRIYVADRLGGLYIFTLTLLYP